MKYMVYHTGMFYPVGFDAWSDQRAIEWAIEDAKHHNLSVSKVKNFMKGEVVYEIQEREEEVS